MQLWKDCDLGNLTIDKYFLHSGVQVQGLLSVFVLQPGTEMILDFGSTSPNSYLLATCEMVPALEPGAEPSLLYAAAHNL